MLTHWRPRTSAASPVVFEPEKMSTTIYGEEKWDTQEARVKAP